MYAPICVLAAALLTAPESAPAPAIDDSTWNVLCGPLCTLALQWEILDPREERLREPEHFVTDIRVLRRRYRELIDAPRLFDHWRFPDKASVGQMLSFNRAYKRHLDVMKPLLPDQATVVTAALRETDQLYQVWDKVHDARSEIYYVPVRRLALKQLRELVGAEAYYTGRLPPHVPVWRFQDVK